VEVRLKLLGMLRLESIMEDLLRDHQVCGWAARDGE
jgi:hypothetical protein